MEGRHAELVEKGAVRMLGGKLQGCRRIAVAWVLMCAWVTPLAAQVRSTIVGPGSTQYPIAVSPLRASGADAALGVQFADRLGRNLQLSGMFRIVPRDTYIEQPQTSGVDAETITFENWSVLGAHALVKGLMTAAGDETVIEARLFDVGRRTQIAGRRYRGTVDDIDRIADRFSDEVINALSGERGPFDSRIAFLSTRGGRFKDVYVMSANGRGLRRLTRTQTLNLAPRWGPRANRLMITSYREGSPDLFAVSYPEGQWRRITRLRGMTLSGGWSPDGEAALATVEFDGNSDIALIAGDGGILQRLTNHPGIDVSPSWSPDGRRIAFCSDRSGSPQIYTMNRDGSNVMRVTRQGTYNTSPRWSPKGDRIAYTSRVGGRFQVFVVGIDGSGTHQVTTHGNNEDPSWSPDGRYLVYSSRERGRARLFLSDIGGIHRVQLTDGEGDDTSPAWSSWLD